MAGVVGAQMPRGAATGTGRGTRPEHDSQCAGPGLCCRGHGPGHVWAVVVGVGLGRVGDAARWPGLLGEHDHRGEGERTRASTTTGARGVVGGLHVGDPALGRGVGLGVRRRRRDWGVRLGPRGVATETGAWPAGDITAKMRAWPPELGHRGSRRPGMAARMSGAVACMGHVRTQPVKKKKEMPTRSW